MKEQNRCLLIVYIYLINTDLSPKTKYKAKYAICLIDFVLPTNFMRLMNEETKEVK